MLSSSFVGASENIFKVQYYEENTENALQELWIWMVPSQGKILTVLVAETRGERVSCHGEKNLGVELNREAK